MGSMCPTRLPASTTWLLGHCGSADSCRHCACCYWDHNCLLDNGSVEEAKEDAPFVARAATQVSEAATDTHQTACNLLNLKQVESVCLFVGRQAFSKMGYRLNVAIVNACSSFTPTGICNYISFMYGSRCSVAGFLDINCFLLLSPLVDSFYTCRPASRRTI
jgi:uncharacterized protein with PQ loop repeat